MNNFNNGYALGNTRDNFYQDDPEDNFQDEQHFNYYNTSQNRFGIPQMFKNNFRNDRYNNAYGNYNGGYRPPGGYNNNQNVRFNFYPPNNFGRPPMFPRGPPGNFAWGRGFGPGGPPVRRYSMDDKSVRYLIRCGVQKENLRNLPREFLNLIEPEYCGLCGQSFDSFAVSRMHYISKNHLKNQKKWLSQQSELGFRRGKEIPIKSRDLYCELCDVHITSKIHSISHYAGKMHRAVVDGRKKPKNPFLLQQGMEERVEQLIRREKKYLRPMDEQTPAKPKQSKPTLLELYCDICKASVTCSEQMTMHLNGRRHLIKEKQHILNMMKGKDDTNSTTNTDNKETEGDCEESEAAETTQSETTTQEVENPKNTDDWENGGENWDEPVKTDG